MPETGREAVIRAAAHCFRHKGVRRTSLDDIASAAGLSRATVYRLFRGREEIVLETLIHLTEKSLRRTVGRLGESGDLAEALVGLVMSTVDGARRDQRGVGLLFSSDVSDRGRSIRGASKPLVGLFEDAVAKLHALHPEPLRVSSEEAGEIVLRVVLSLLTFEPPEPRSGPEERAFVGRILLPAVLERS